MKYNLQKPQDCADQTKPAAGCHVALSAIGTEAAVTGHSVFGLPIDRSTT